MARIKYSDEFNPLRKKHFGFTFIANHYGQSILPAQRYNRTRYSNQFKRMQNLQKCVRFWRTMAPATKAAWDNFAATYPQPSKRNPLIPLTGYQLFLKRNHYCFLNFDITTDFLELPEMVSLPVDTPIFTLTAGLNSIDLTELYIANFGIIPIPGQWLQFMAVPYSETSGQFFEPIYNVLEVLNTYIDGFFLNIETPGNVAGITYSVYLSKPLNKGSYIKSSKVRFMGCFTTKSFLGLSDTPNSYTGQAGKTVKVKADETGLEFGDGGGGGLTCEDLPDCPTIIQINEQIVSIADYIIPLSKLSIPPLKLGLLYNKYAAIDSRLPSASGWRCPSDTDWINIRDYLGGASVAGQKMKENNPLYWSINTGTNTALFFARGLITRDAAGSFATSKFYSSTWSSSDPVGSATCSYWFCTYNVNTFNTATGGSQWVRGYAVRLCRNVTGISDYTMRAYQGNNGQIYRTVVINNIEWLADNLAETLFSDGSAIPEVTDAASWAALTTPALCAGSNDWNNV